MNPILFRNTNNRPAMRQLTPSERRSAYSALARSIESDLNRTALYLCKGQSDWAKDLVQDALIKGYVAYRDGKFGEGENFRAWMIRILTNQYIDEYRRKTKWEAGVDVDIALTQSQTEPFGSHASIDDLPGGRLLADTLDEPIEKALMSLAEDVRLCVVLVDVQDMNYADAAKALNIPLGTVKSRLARGRTILHTLLADYITDKTKGQMK